MSKLTHDAPTPPTLQPENRQFTFLQKKVAEKTRSARADSIIALRQFLEVFNSPEDCNPLTFYKMSPDEMEPFKATAKQYLCVPATSTASERAFSKAGQIITDRISCLKPQTVDKLLFLNKNADDLL
nr:uncharacterized protein LOC122321135 [Drosophila bipectinata]